MRFLLTVVSVLVFVTCLASCSGGAGSDLEPGGLYLIDLGDGAFGVVKLLVLENGIAHIRLYSDVYETRPDTIDPGSLRFGGIDDPEGFGIGHLPIEESEFRAWQPELMAMSEVTPEELEGYKLFKEYEGQASGSTNESPEQFVVYGLVLLAALVFLAWSIRRALRRY